MKLDPGICKKLILVELAKNTLNMMLSSMNKKIFPTRLNVEYF